MGWPRPTAGRLAGGCADREILSGPLRGWPARLRSMRDGYQSMRAKSWTALLRPPKNCRTAARNDDASRKWARVLGGHHDIGDRDRGSEKVPRPHLRRADAVPGHNRQLR